MAPFLTHKQCSMNPSVLLGIALLLVGCASASDSVAPARPCERVDFGDDRYLCQGLNTPDATVGSGVLRA